MGRNVYSIVFSLMASSLGVPRWRRFAGAEGYSRAASQCLLNLHCDRVRATEHAPRDPFYFLERRHGLAEIVERGAVVFVEARDWGHGPELLIDDPRDLVAADWQRRRRRLRHLADGDGFYVRRRSYAVW